MTNIERKFNCHFSARKRPSWIHNSHCIVEQHAQAALTIQLPVMACSAGLYAAKWSIDEKKLEKIRLNWSSLKSEWVLPPDKESSILNNGHHFCNDALSNGIDKIFLDCLTSLHQHDIDTVPFRGSFVQIIRCSVAHENDSDSCESVGDPSKLLGK